MRKLVLIALAALIAAIPAKAQKKDSGPLAFVSSDVNPKTVFWIQGRFIPVDNPKFQGDAEVATILCAAREHECIEVDSEAVGPDVEQAWIEDLRPIQWDKRGIVATSRSLDGCTDETLKIRFSPPSVVLINSPVLPMSENCKKINHAWDKLTGERGSALKSQTEEDMLVPTRGFLPWQDSNSNHGKISSRAPKKNP